MPESPPNPAPVTLPLPALRRHHKRALEDLIARAGNAAHLARMLDVHYMTVRGWITRDRISRDGAKRVEAHPVLGEYFTAQDLRPEIQE